MWKCGHLFKRAISFDDLVHFIDQEDIVTNLDFDCGITFYPEAPTKVEKFNREEKSISRSCETPKCITNNDQQNCCIDEENTSIIFFQP